ncbi:MAG: nicotinate-nucleotide--dimethylbenzimidazole phosphoribosyltransferase, partial [Boseongicola sp.]|nr:nicotinate-nucleotide--dimethylbenzimidazole phosphoribosyltransferase [Boseongicola sp.]
MAEQTAFAAELQHKIDTKTKPLGALGRIEEMAAQIATLQQTLTPKMETCQLTIFAADHGIAQSGVSLFPQEVTRQMVLNFAGGGAAANVFARTNGIDLRVVNAGVAGDAIDAPGLIDRRVGAGTANSLTGPAMTTAERDQAIAYGEALGTDGDSDAVAFGEMGIGNTSAAALIAHKLTDTPLDVLTGRGTGLDDDGLSKKTEILTQAASRTGNLDAAETLAEYGGFEIAMMAGAMMSAAS